MDQEQKLENQIKEYSALAKENKNIDVAKLMIATLENANDQKARAAGKSYKWPYLISIGIPPIGLLFAAKYYLTGDDNDKQAANICILLTLISFSVFWFFGKNILGGSGTSVQQIEQIRPQDIQELTR